MHAAGDDLKVTVTGLALLKGDLLARLKDGGSARIELALMVLPGRGETPLAERRQVFTLSYDLWEERFAVTAADSPPRTASHLTSSAAEAWCVDQLGVPLAAPGMPGRGQPFWIRLEYRILNGDGGPEPDDDAGFTLQGLIEALSRRRKADEAPRSVEGGPFRLEPRRPGASSPR